MKKHNLYWLLVHMAPGGFTDELMAEWFDLIDERN